jgi:Chaperone of endosialidase
MSKPYTIFASLLLLVTCFTNAQAQSDIAKSVNADSLSVTASASGERLRFTAPSSVVQIRLEVYNSIGKKLFDIEVRSGNVLDWHLQDGQAEPLADGSYLCVITVKSLSGKLTQRIGSVTVEKNSASVQPVDTSQISALQSQAIGPVEENASVIVLKQDDNQTTTVIAHNGEDGQITRGRGALSFRIGDFFSGKDIEQMRLTPEGNLGIGITHPLVRLDVDGLVRATQGIVFPDGSIQYSAATKTFGAKSSLPDPSFQSLQSKSGKGGQEHIDAAGTGTLNFIPKWQETGGAGTLQNSSIFDDGFNLGVGTSSPGGVFDLQRASSSDLLQRFWNTGTGGAKLRYVASVGATSQIQLTDLNEWLMSIAGNNSIGLQFRVRDVGDANDEATLAARPRMSILRNGNVGIGTTNPVGVLHAKGSSPVRIIGETSTLSGSEFVDFFARNTPFASDMGGMRIQRQSSTGDVDTIFFAAPTGNSAAEMMRVRGNGNVGIGTTGPGFKLDVADRMRVRQGASGSAGLWLFQTTPKNDRAFVGMFDDTHVGLFGNTGAGWNFLMDTTNGNVGIGTMSPSYPLSVSGNGGAGSNTAVAEFSNGTSDTAVRIKNDSAGGRAWALDASGTGSVFIGPGNFTILDATANAARLSINSLGNVGVGTTFPGAPLEVRRDANIVSNWQNAQLRISGATNPNMQLNLGYDTTNNAGVIQPGQSGVEFKNLLLNPAGGNIGIGATSPLTQLHIRKDVSNALGPSITLMNGAGGNGAGASIDFDGYDTGNNSPTARISSLDDGNFSSSILFEIKQPGSASNPLLTPLRIFSSALVQVHGDFNVFGGNTSVDLAGGGAIPVCQNSNHELATCGSSLRYKEQIRPFGAGLEVLRKLQPVTYIWKDNGQKDLGLVAEQVQAVDPLLVTYNASGTLEGVKYDRLAVLLINAVRDQQEQIGRQQEQLKRQQKEIKQQQALVAGQRQALGALKRLVCRSGRRARACQ